MVILTLNGIILNIGIASVPGTVAMLNNPYTV